MVAAAAVVGAGATLASGAMASDAAGDAAAGQERATAQSNALQRYMYDRNVELQMPTIEAGNAARNRLLYGLGLSPTGTSSSTPTQTYDQLRSQLVGQYTTYGAPQGAAAAGAPKFDINTLPFMDRISYARITDPAARAEFEAQHLGQPTSVRDNSGANTGVQGDTLQWQNAPQNVATIDENALNSEIERRLAEQDAGQRAAEEAARSDPNYGRLSQEFQFDTYTPEKYQAADKYEAGKFSYTGEDLYKDPSYQFRLEQGQKALDRAGLAAGRFLSGRQLQASSDYNQGAASQEFQAGYGRALGTFNTNEGNRFNAFNTNETNRYNAFSTNETNRFNAFDTNQQNRFNAHQANFSNTINPLLSLSGAGQVGAQFLGGAGERTAQLIGNNTTAAANATGAAGIAGANAVGNGLTGAVNGYQQNQLLQTLLNRPTGVNNNPGVQWGSSDTLFGSGGFFSGNRGSGD
jgi:hypothetical protein